jgi:hypothetical protein
MLKEIIPCGRQTRRITRIRIGVQKQMVSLIDLFVLTRAGMWDLMFVSPHLSIVAVGDNVYDMALGMSDVRWRCSF